MTTTTTKTKQQLETEARELAAQEVLVETNSGTYGATEACRKVGVGDPAFATRNVYERVGDGQRRTTGPDVDEMPGYTRYLNADDLRAKRAKLAQLRAKIKRLA